MIPTIQQTLDKYQEIAKIERIKNARPNETTVFNAIFGVRRFCEAGGIGLNEPLSAITRQRLDSAFLAFEQSGLKRISAATYMGQFKAILARWCRPYYKDFGWEIPAIEYPIIRAIAPRYKRPSADFLRRVKEWYVGLKGEKWFAATMMLEFAMRNGDVLRLTDANFVTQCVTTDGTRRTCHFLSYTPHKTALSSGRVVRWRICDEVWQLISDYGGASSFAVKKATLVAINRDIRELGATGSKAAYELRKICIDHVYQKYGVECAVSISGDDIRTISRYYTDLTQASADRTRVIDMM